MTPFNLKNKVAIVTGGGSGIGESICTVFAQAGADVRIIELDAELGEQVADRIRNGGGKANAYAGDVRNQAEIIAICNDLAAEAGSLDILVSNAGIAHIGKLCTTTEADLDRVYAVNVKGVYNSMYAVIEHMKRQKRGVILNLASIASLLGLPDRFAYSMSKGAVLTMTYTVAKDYLDDNIRCNSIAPARVHTPFVDNFLAKNYPGREAEMFGELSKMQPIGRMARPLEIAYLALYLCSDEAGFITGTNFPIDGGFIKLNT